MTQAEEIKELRDGLADLRAEVGLLRRREDQRQEAARAEGRLSGVTEVELREMKQFRDDIREQVAGLVVFRGVVENLIRVWKYFGILAVTLIAALLGFAINGMVGGIRLEARVGEVERRVGEVEGRLTKIEDQQKRMMESLARIEAGQKKP